jgi:hypothetical protein
MDQKDKSEPPSPFQQLQDAGLGNLMGMNSEWFEAIGKMQAEVARFIANRLEDDVKTQQQLLQCKTVSDLQHVQAQFIQRAMDQYQEETGKLVEMSADLLGSAGSKASDDA